LDKIPPLGRIARRRLVRLGRKTGDPATALRFLMVAKLGMGLSRNQVAHCLGVAVSTVVNTARRYLDCGIDGLYDRRALNGRPKVDQAFLLHVSALLCDVPLDFGWQRPTWTRELLCLAMQRRGFPAVAVCTMGRVLCAIGARLGMARPMVLCPWRRARRRRRLAELKRLASRASPQEPVVYVDEVDIHLNPRIGRDWMLPGMQRRILTPGQNEKRYLAGALDARTRSLTWVEGDRKTSDLFCKLVWRLVNEHRRARRIHIILDNYIIHSSKRTKRNLAQFGDRVVLHFLPPYCPDHNKIERVWLDLHANVTRNHRCRRMPELMANVHAYLKNRNRLHRVATRSITVYRESGSAI
jgi:transposase